MPIREYISETDFGPEEVKAMSIAMSGVLASLQLTDKPDNLIRLVAEKVIELARNGEHDPERLEAAVLKELRQ